MSGRLGSISAERLDLRALVPELLELLDGQAVDRRGPCSSPRRCRRWRRRSRVYFTPPFSQTGTSSSSSIGREAVEMSVSPAQNFSKPPPVPDVPTVICTSGFSSLNSSAAASRERGHRRRAVDRDLAADVAAVGGRLLGRAPPERGGLVVVVAAGGDAERERAREGEQPQVPSSSLQSILFSVGPHPCERDVKAPARAGIRSRSACGRSGTPAGRGRAWPAACGRTRRRSGRSERSGAPQTVLVELLARHDPCPGGAPAPRAGRARAPRAAARDRPPARGARPAGPPDPRPAAPRLRASAPSARQAAGPGRRTGYRVVNGP